VFADERRETPVYERATLCPGHEITGPAIIEGDESTVVVPPSWDVQVGGDGTLRAEVNGQ